MKIKVSEATPIQLNWLVAKCEGYTDWCPETEKLMPPRKKYGWVMFCDLDYVGDWSQGGPIIEREGIELLCNLTATEAARFSTPGVHADWQAFYRNRRMTEERSFATTPLIASMRCYVTSKLGDEVEVPDELA